MDRQRVERMILRMAAPERTNAALNLIDARAAIGAF